MDEHQWGKLRAAVARCAWREVEALARGDEAREAYMMACATRVVGGVRAVEHWRIVSELEQAQARGEVWGAWRGHGALSAGAYLLDIAWTGVSAHAVASVYYGQLPTPLLSEGLKALEGGARAVEAQALLLRAMTMIGAPDGATQRG